MTDLSDYAIRSELERKTLEEIERILFGFSKKRMNKGEALQAIQVLWNTVSGLVASETMNLITSSRAEIERSFDPRPSEQVAVMSAQNAGVVLVRKGSLIQVISCGASFALSEKDKSKSADVLFPELAASDAIGALINHYSQKGFKPLT